MTQNSDSCGIVDRGAARRIVLSTLALAIATASALAASETDANAAAREIIAFSYGFANSLLPNRGLEHLAPLSPFSEEGTHECWLNCGPALGATIVRRSAMLTSNTGDVSPRKTIDGTGHPMGLGGMVMTERLEPDASGSLTNWVVTSERTVDENGSHSWSLLSSAPSDSPWLPNDLYRFEGSFLAVDRLADTPTTPEASTWAMMVIGLASLGAAHYRRTRNSWRLTQSLMGDTSR